MKEKSKAKNRGFRPDPDVEKFLAGCAACGMNLSWLINTALRAEQEKRQRKAA